MEKVVHIYQTAEVWGCTRVSSTLLVYIVQELHLYKVFIVQELYLYKVFIVQELHLYIKCS